MKSPPQIYQTPFNPYSESERRLLLEQRKACGWYDSIEEIDEWCRQLKQDDPGWSLKWVRKARHEPPIGHTGFCWRHDDPDLASPERKRCMGFRLWIHPDHRAGGYARAAWASNYVEGYERGCTHITGTTFADRWAMDKQYYADRGAKWGIHHQMPMEYFYTEVMGATIFKRANTFKYTWPNGHTEVLEVVYFDAPIVPEQVDWSTKAKM